MVLAGQTNTGTTNKVELIVLKNKTFTCPYFPPLPSGIYGALGGIAFDAWFQEKPMICGGTIGTTVQHACFTLKRNGKWSNQINLIHGLSYTNAIESPFRDFELFTAAGYNGRATNFSLEYHDSMWVLAKANLPVSVWLHCTIKLDETTVMVTGGVQGSTESSDKTFLLNASLGNDWTRGEIQLTANLFSLNSAKYW